jgi:hypothetical protein
MNTVVDMVQQKTNAKLRSVMLCTDWTDKRGSNTAFEKCWKDENTTYAFFHPYKIGVNGRMGYDEMYERLQ